MQQIKSRITPVKEKKKQKKKTVSVSILIIPKNLFFNFSI